MSRLKLHRLALVGVALSGVGVAYWQTLGFGFRYDDYHLVRPWASAELWQVLHGSWDPSGIESSFYRPFAVYWFALRFVVFGLNAVAQHAISLVGMAIAAVLAGLFVERETESPRAGLLAAGLYAVHPAFVYSQAVWLTNQMHLVASLVVLTALVVWQRVRSRSVSSWWPLLVLQLIAFGIKEDTVMLAPVLLLLTCLRAAVARDISWPGWRVWLGALVVPIGLFATRYAMLGRLGGYGALPSVDLAWTRFRGGLFGILRHLPAARPWQPFVSAWSQLLLVVGGAASFFRRRHAYLWLAGLGIAIGFNAPFVFVTKAEQYHLVALGAVIMLAASAEAIISLVPIRLPRALATGAVVLASFSFLPVTWNIASDFAPCSRGTLYTDTLSDWWIVPVEIQDWLHAKDAACGAGTLVPLPAALDTATWGFGPETDEAGQRYQWTSTHSVMFVTPRARHVSLALRRTNGSGLVPVIVTVQGGGSTTRLKVTNAEWQFVTLNLSPSWRTRLRGMHWVDIDVTPAFVPSRADPESRDNRQLGVQLRVLSVDQ